LGAQVGQRPSVKGKGAARHACRRVVQSANCRNVGMSKNTVMKSSGGVRRGQT